MSYKEQIAEQIIEILSLDNRYSYWNGATIKAKLQDILDVHYSLLTEDKCPECGGDGQDHNYAPHPDGNRPKICPKCHGTGKRVKECPKCEGHGKLEVPADGKRTGLFVPCDMCDGKGWLPDDGLLTPEEQAPFEISRRVSYGDVTVTELDVDTKGLLKAQHDKDLIRFNAQDLYVLDEELLKETIKVIQSASSTIGEISNQVHDFDLSKPLNNTYHDLHELKMKFVKIRGY